VTARIFAFGGHAISNWRGKRRSTGHARKALLVADLHLEKASSYAMGGQFLPAL
jgi:hypothetical protein